jgi:general secretion pathway protein C
VRFYRSDARRRKAFHDNRRMFARLSAFVIWSLVAATGIFWILRLSASPPQVPPYAVAVGNAVSVRGDLSRLFGAPQRAPSLAQATPEAPSRFKLVGVMAPRSNTAQAEVGHGLALIAVDGKPAKPFVVGARLDSDLVLQAVGLRTASIGPAQGARSVLLELPALPAPNSGVLPPPGAGAAALPVPATVPGAGAPAALGGSTRMQSAIQAVQAAQAAQAGHAGPAPLPGQSGATPNPHPGGAAPTVGVPQAPVTQPAQAEPGPPLAPPAPSLPTPGGPQTR